MGKTGAIDMVMDPTNENVLYVGFWQRLRRPYRFDSGGPNGGIFKIYRCRHVLDKN